MHAFTESVAELGESCLQLYQRGDKSIVMFLAIEEPNLIRARELAKSREWWGAVMGAMQGLYTLYEHKGRWAEWELLVNELKPFFVDERTQGPLSGREHEWRMLMDYCIRLAQESQNWAEAERYQRIDVKWRRQVAARVLDANPKTLDHDGRNAIRSLAVALNELGLSERETGNADCKCTFEEVINLSKRIGDYGLEAVASLNLGVAYVTLDALYDLDKAEQCYRHGLDLVLERDTLTRSKYLSELGFIYWARFNKAQEAQQPKDELERYFNDARGFYEAALSLTPPDALASLAVKHNALGQIYGRAGLFDESMLHYRKAILYLERSGDLFNAGKTRLGAAQVLRNAHSPQDALDYAYSALDNLKQFNVIGLIRACEELIARLEREIKEKQG
jgi:tetratricopeptide (TPR) repeat protein